MLPANLVVLKLHGNPCIGADNKFAYRREFVKELGDLEELDKIKVLPAERLSYQGHLPKMNLRKMLEDLEMKT